MIEILRGRRSIRQYKKKAIDASSLEVIKEALLRCPSSRGINPWTFIFVDDPQVLQHLSLAKPQGSGFLKEAALGIVVCGDETKTDVWVEDCSIASIVAQLAAQSLGLGSCWSQIRNRPHTGEKTAEEYVQGLLGIPRNLKVLSIIGVGHPAEVREAIGADQLDYGKIRYNRY
jgi:nitroreductase